MKLTKKDIKEAIKSYEQVVQGLKIESKEHPQTANHNQVRIYKTEGKIELLKSYL